MPHSPKDSYRILELNPDASLEAVKRSYRNLVKLWHPDRYTPGSSMQGIAQEKIKDINLAYAELCKRLAKEAPTAATGPDPVRNAYAAGSATRDASPPPRRPSRPVETAPPPRRPRATGRPETADQERARPAPRRKPEMREPEPESARPSRASESKDASPENHRRIRSDRPIVLAVLGLGVVAAGIILFVNRWPHPGPGSAFAPSAARLASTEAKGRASTVAAPVTPRSPSAQVDPDRLDRRPQEARPEVHLGSWTELVSRDATARADEPRVTVREAFESTFSGAVFADLPRASRSIIPSEKPFWMRSLETATGELDAFTIGTARADVIKLQGRPDRETPSVLCYGTSTVLLSAGKVTAWYRGDTPLKAREAREVAYDIAATFTVGSSKAEVVLVQGAPQHASDNVFQYGSSFVEFRDGRVVRWREGVPTLRVHVMAEATYGRTERFTVGSTRAQVIAIQGPPDSESDSVLQYGTAKVILGDGRVTSWEDRIGLLRARLATARMTRPGV